MVDRFLSPGEAGVLNRLRDQADEIAATERRLKAMKKRRDLLILKAATAGIPERQIAAVAGVSNVRCNQIKRAAS